MHWDYKSAEDVIKMEVWDVVDKALPRDVVLSNQAHVHADDRLAGIAAPKLDPKKRGRYGFVVATCSAL